MEGPKQQQSEERVDTPVPGPADTSGDSTLAAPARAPLPAPGYPPDTGSALFPVLSGADTQFRQETGELIAGRYRIISLLGQGGMGSVYRVEQVFLRKQFALKTLRSDIVSKEMWRRFQKEAKAASLLDHPNLIKVQDFGLINDQQPFFVMDLVEGETLAQMIKERNSPLSEAAKDSAELFKRGWIATAHDALPLQTVLEIFVQACRGLGYAHGKGVIHRDIKPGNIMVAHASNLSEMNVKVVDFGIAKLLATEAPESIALTRTGEIFGTPYYMSPEQCLGLSVNQAADIYSLGCVLFEALTGFPPFIGDSALAIMIKHQSEKPPTLKEASLGRSFAPDLEKVVAKLLEKEPRARYDNLLAVAADLERIKIGKALEPDERESTLVVKKKRNFRFPKAAFLLFAILISSAVAFWAGRDSAPQRRLKEPDKSVRFDDGGSPTIETVATDTIFAPGSVGSRGSHFSARTSPQSTTRCFHFPERESLGRIFSLSLDSKIYAYSRAKAEFVGAESQEAQGEIVIEHFHPVGLQPKGAIGLDPGVLRRFYPDEILSLDCYYYPWVSNNIIGSASKFTELKTLVLKESPQVTNKSIDYINALPRLKDLDVGSTSIDADGLVKLKRLRNLEMLGAQGVEARKLLPALKGSQALQVLYVSKSELDDPLVPLLLTLPKLRFLDVSRNHISDKAVAELAKIPNLIELHVFHNPLTPACIPYLGQMRLKVLELSAENWSSADKQKLFQALSGCYIAFRHDDERGKYYHSPDFAELRHMPEWRYQGNGKD